MEVKVVVEEEVKVVVKKKVKVVEVQRSLQRGGGESE